MTIEINHGEPKTPYFVIAQPKRTYNEPRGGMPRPVVVFKDEKTGSVLFKAEFHGNINYTMDELVKSNTLPLLAYGCKADFLKEHLIKKYPELNKPDAIVEFWILKRI